MPFSRNLNVPIAALVAAVALATPAVASDTTRAASSSGTEELETVVADTLTALGVDTDVVDALTDAAVREASERLGTLRDDGSFTDDQLATLTKRTHDGTLYEQVSASIGDIRTRLAAVRDAAEARLAEIGAHLEDDRAVRDALLDHGIDPSMVIADLLDLLPVVPPTVPPATLPPTDTTPAPTYPTPAPTNPDPAPTNPDPAPIYPVYPTPEPGPAPTYPVYPTPEPGPAPTYPVYPTPEPGPAPIYPSIHPADDGWPDWL
jgi:hypothetical protein